MTLWDFIIMLVVAAIIGAIGEAIGGYSPGGCLMSIVVGFVGAFVGRYIRIWLGLPTFWVVNAGGTKFAVVWSIIGAAVCVAILRLVLHRRSAT